MANAISLFKNYTSLLDEVYQSSAKTAVLESDSTLARMGANANEIIIPKLAMDGLGDYNRSSGYPAGDIALTNETVSFNYERGRMFSVDYMDNEETAGVAFGRLSGEFIRTKVAPELDAVRFAAYASALGIGKADDGAYEDGEAVLAALVAAMSEMDEKEVPSEDRHLFITPLLYNLAVNTDLITSKAVLDLFSSITKVSQSGFVTGVDLLDGISAGEESGGFVKADSAKDINFMIIHKKAVLQITKHSDPKVILPKANPDADAYKFGYRIYALNDVYDNKVSGIYLSNKA